MTLGGSEYLLQHTLRDLHMLHGDDLAQLRQWVNVTDFIHELHTEENIEPHVVSATDAPVGLCNSNSFMYCVGFNINPFIFCLVSVISDSWAHPHLMKGLEMARTVRMNHVGWVMMRHFRFFLSLQETFKWFCDVFNLNIIDSLSPTFINFPPTVVQSALIVSALLPVNHLVAPLQPADAGASSCEEWLRSGKRSCNLLPPEAPGCSPHIWQQSRQTHIWLGLERRTRILEGTVNVC